MAVEVVFPPLTPVFIWWLALLVVFFFLLKLVECSDFRNSSSVCLFPTMGYPTVIPSGSDTASFPAILLLQTGVLPRLSPPNFRIRSVPSFARGLRLVDYFVSVDGLISLRGPRYSSSSSNYLFNHYLLRILHLTPTGTYFIRGWVSIERFERSAFIIFFSTYFLLRLCLLTLHFTLSDPPSYLNLSFLCPFSPCSQLVPAKLYSFFLLSFFAPFDPS